MVEKHDLYFVVENSIEGIKDAKGHCPNTQAVYNKFKKLKQKHNS